MGRFNKGILLGSALGAGLMWLMSSTKGKAVREQMIDYAADAYTKLRDQVVSSESYDKLTKARYVTLVKQFVDTYAHKYELAEDVKKLVSKLLTSQWHRIRQELKKK